MQTLLQRPQARRSGQGIGCHCPTHPAKTNRYGLVEAAENNRLARAAIAQPIVHTGQVHERPFSCGHDKVFATGRYPRDQIIRDRHDIIVLFII